MDLTIICNNAQISTYNSHKIEVQIDRLDNKDEIIAEFTLSDIISVIGTDTILDHIGQETCMEHFGLEFEADNED